MRELKTAEIELVSGGEEEPLVPPEVVVVGQRIERDPWLIRQQLDMLSSGSDLIRSIIGGAGAAAQDALDAIPDPDTCEGQHLSQIADLQQERNAAVDEIERLSGSLIGDQDPVQAQIDAAMGSIFTISPVTSPADVHQSNWENLIQPGLNNMAQIAALEARVEQLNQEISNLGESAQDCGN